MIRPLIASVVLACASSAHAHPEIEAALGRLNSLIASSPVDADLYVERGELYARHEEWISAEANYLRATELAPDHPRLARARGALELATKRPAAARAFLDVALARDPRDAEALVLRARARAALQDNHGADADLKAALALLPNPRPELFLERAALLPASDAIRSLDAAMARIGPAHTLQLQALDLEVSSGQIDAALTRLDRIMERSERKEAWLKRRGDLLSRVGRVDEARAAYASALAAIASLPAWLRESPDTARLVAELSRLTASHI